MNEKHTKYFVFTEIMENRWNNTTLAEFVKIRAILGDAERSHEDKLIALAALIQGVDEETILTMPLDRVEPVFEAVQQLNEPPKRSRIRSHYQAGRWALKVTEAKDMTVAQWIDFQNYYRDDMEKHLADILSVALVPVGKKYNEGYDIDALKAALWDMPVGDALAVCFFFQKKWLKSMRRTLSCLAGWTAVKGQRELKETALRLRTEISAMLRSL